MYICKEFKTNIMKQIIKLQVRVEIEYNENEEGSREYAIKIAKENVIGIKTYGYPESVKPLTSKLLK